MDTAGNILELFPLTLTFLYLGYLIIQSLPGNQQNQQKQESGLIGSLSDGFIYKSPCLLNQNVISR